MFWEEGIRMIGREKQVRGSESSMVSQRGTEMKGQERECVWQGKGTTRKINLTCGLVRDCEGFLPGARPEP